ncbi:MAG TPA: CGNR zinc finger domain-containing protein [Actinomycetota bacterium]
MSTDLELVAAFVNTLDVGSGRDALESAEALRGWLVQRGLLGGDHPVTEADLGRALAVREAIRGLAERNNPGAGTPPDAEPLETLNRLAGGSRLVLSFGPEGDARLESVDEGVPGALGRILAAVFLAMTDGRWERFKACARDSCRWVYVDRSRNRSRTWCSMDVCGNREKARAFRERRKAKR